MDKDVAKARVRAFMEEDFLPISNGQDHEQKSTSALQYMAYNIGQINKKLGRLIELMEAAEKK